MSPFKIVYNLLYFGETMNYVIKICKIFIFVLNLPKNVFTDIQR